MPDPNSPAPFPMFDTREAVRPFTIAEKTQQTVAGVQQGINGMAPAAQTTLISHVLALGAQVLPPLLIMGGIWWGVQTIMGNPPKPIRQLLA